MWREKMWNREQAIDMCRAIEAICPAYGCHVALTGGLLYKDGPRKDADILFYCIRQVDEIDIMGLCKALIAIGMNLHAQKGWVLKGTWEGRSVDLFFPEAYPSSSTELASGEY